MLLELRVENLLLIQRTELRLGPGLNVITGETGAGKTVLAGAVDLLLGGKPRAGTVRPGAEEAWVEGVFELPAGLFDAPAAGAEPESSIGRAPNGRNDLLANLRERVPQDAEEVVLGRRVSAGGRTSAFVQGRAATAADLRELGGRLVSFLGQHEHRRLTVAAAQLEVLDAFCGPSHLELRAAYAAAYERARECRRELEDLRARAGARERDLDLLVFEIGEIEELEPSSTEHATLTSERDRLRHLESLRAAAGGAAEALAPESGETEGATALLARAEAFAEGPEGVDPALDALAGRLRDVRIEVDDVAAELRRYGTGLEGEPGRLEEAESRLELYDRLLRKHGGSVASVLDHLERCRTERERLAGIEEAAEDLEGALAEAGERERRLAAELSAARREAVPALEERVLGELARLALEDASFSAQLRPRDELGPQGAEGVEFMLAANPGVPAAPLRETASGGELSRVMLALFGVASAGGSQTLVFDEVDAGVGGQTANAVGERLQALGAYRQVLCITHLPQVAALAERHFRIEKRSEADLARTEVARLEGDQVVEELCRMMGAEAGDAGARRHARKLLAAA
ncbi:MAG: DNA repair protein RecN [Actinomycetota bacterium]|nr:DNA repair protein RecN [Actinomycetota bacterium]